ncbi:hypothetical protein CI109_101083 [Kwoniella shandongensis]|uniref:Uncharacterized protein n=1 Tax=Kwoniella shandongensis TaxID=1734106 RepID=A0AAJ8LDN2_9TREE
MKIYQCAVMGSGGVGKSAVTVRFINGSYLEWYDPTNRKQFTVDQQPCLLEILDTAGIDQYLTLNDLFIRKSEGFVLVFSLTQRDSFEEIIRTRETIERIKLPQETGHGIPIVIVGNKCDLVDEREVDMVEGEKLAQQWHCHYYETSARTATNVNPVFEEIVRQMRLQDYRRNQSREGGGGGGGGREWVEDLRRRRKERGKRCVIL